MSANLDVKWILKAHKGTLEKLSMMLCNDCDYGTIKLLAIARNLFENLVWLKLFNHNSDYGIVFYNELPPDHEAVYKAITRYTIVDLDKCYERLGYKSEVIVNGMKKWGFISERSFSAN